MSFIQIVDCLNRSRVADSARNGYQQKEENCSQCRSEGGNFQMTEERGFHYLKELGPGRSTICDIKRNEDKLFMVVENLISAEASTTQKR